MVQLTLRIDDALRDRLKQVASDRGVSANAFAEMVLRAALDPDTAPDEASRVRERLARAGLLAQVAPRSGSRPPEPDVARAAAAAGRGRPLSDYVGEGRD
jgi:hypothetical protein